MSTLITATTNDAPLAPQAIPTTTAPGPRRARIDFLDNLRTFLVFLVIVYHAGIVYESSGVGATFWIVDDPATNNLSGLVNLVLDVFVMAGIFFVAGFFAPRSLTAKPGLAFLKSKFRRLMVPWLFAVLTLVPLYKMLFLASRDLPQDSWGAYFHFSNGLFGQSWLWFLPVLFLFETLFWLGSKLRLDLRWLSFRAGLAGAALVGFGYSLAMDLLELRGWTKTVLFDFQNERLAIYFLVFLLGALGSERRIFEGPKASNGLFHTVNSLAWLPTTAYLVFLLYPWLNPGKVLLGPVVDRVIVWSSFHLALAAWIFALVETFRRIGDRRNKLSTALAQTSYSIYIVHTVVLGAVATLLLDVALPSVVKYLVLSVATFAVSHGLAVAWRRLVSQPRRASA